MAAQTDQTIADTLPIIKVWIVLDTQTNSGSANGTGLDSENVYTNPAATALTGLAPLRNMLYSKRFKVLKEIDVVMPSMPMSFDATNVEQQGIETSWDCFINLKGIKTEFIANAGTVADISTNGIFLLAACSNASFAPSLAYNARLRFRG